MQVSTLKKISILAVALCFPVLVARSKTPSASPTVARPFVAVQDGANPAPIIVFRDAPPRTMAAAEDFADYIQKASGVRPQVLHGAPDPLPERAIWIGKQPELAKAFPGLDLELQHPEEILLAANENHLLIAGRDRWDPANLVVQVEGRPVEGWQQEYGTANAIYTFLQKYMGVRWLWPGSLGEDVPERKTLSFAPFEYRYHPQIRDRSGIFYNASLNGKKFDAGITDWLQRQRLRLDSISLDSNHAFVDWWDKYHDTHPEYFALQPNGTRDGFPGPGLAKICEANPAVWDQWLKNVDEQLAANPTATMFGAAANDSWASGHCVCPLCVAWDPKNPGELLPFAWEKVTEGGGLFNQRAPLSDRQVRFANQLGDMLAKKYPGKDYKVVILAYGLSRPAPIEAVPNEHVIVVNVANFGMKGDKEREKPMQQFAAWGKVAPLMTWRPNIGSTAGLWWGMPDIALHQTISDFRFIAENHTIGVYIDSHWHHWATQGPGYYIMAQMAWDPWQDGQAMLDDYYERGFGPAAPEIKAYWDLMESTRQDFVNKVATSLRVFIIPDYYPPKFFEKAAALLDTADGKVKDSAPKYRERIAFVRSGLQHAQLVVETRDLMRRWEKNPNDAEALAGVKANWAKADKFRATFPAYAINYRSVFSVPKHKHAVGLHWENPISKRARQELDAADLE